MKKAYCIGVAVLTLVLIARGNVAAQNRVYRDGVYEGQHSFVKVRVTVEEGRITDIEILEHGGGGEKYEKMIAPLVTGIIEQQSFDVDGITGATVSSDNLKQAIINALAAGPGNEPPG